MSRSHARTAPDTSIDSPENVERIRRMATILRREVLSSTTRAGSGHPTSCMSAAELVAAIFFGFLRFDVGEPKKPENDRFVLSKGHAAPILYAALAEAGAFAVGHLDTLRQLGSVFEGHPSTRNPWVDVATGSLGQGLSAGLGMALAARLEGVASRIFVLLGDGEMAEGSVWEAVALAQHLEVDRLTAIVDVNRFGQSEPTMHGHSIDRFVDQFRAFGWHSEAIDGHDVGEILRALERAEHVRGRPAAIVARTFKGRGVSFLEDQPNWHGKALSPAELDEALAELPDPRRPAGVSLVPPIPPPDVELDPAAALVRKAISMEEVESRFLASPTNADPVATREAFGRALVRLGELCPNLVVLDGDVKNSTGTEAFSKAHPSRFFECYIAEQNMVGMATGMGARGLIPFVATFSAFLTRAFDFIRMAGISGVELKLCGSHAGVSIGQDGPSQMGLEDLAMMRAVRGSTVLYPSDAVAAEHATLLALKTPGIVYVRTSRPKTPLLYDESTRFEVGRCKILRQSGMDRVTLISSGVTLHQALEAAMRLEKSGIRTRVIDVFSVKPIDSEALIRAARETHALITIEDHYPEGGIGEAVLTALAGEPCAFLALAVRETPRSGTPEELLELYGLDAGTIVRKAEALLAEPTQSD